MPVPDPRSILGAPARRSAPRERWPRTAQAAIALQRELADRVVLTEAPVPRRLVGLDCAFQGDEILAAAVVWDTADRIVIETRTARMGVRFPYIPGLLSFREVPVLEKVLGRIRCEFQGIMCDGQGIAHPRRFGLASHLGVRLGLATVGCAKSRLCGRYEPPGPCRGDWSPLLMEQRMEQRMERIGTVLRTRDRVNPLFVSPGHLTDHASSIAWVLACGAGFRLPEPTRRADRLVGEYKRTARLKALAMPGGHAPAPRAR
jgi:deoxyribonuclease V